MNQLEYWFDKLKLGGSTDSTPIKQKFQEMMLQNGALTQRGTDVFNAIWGNLNLRSSLFSGISDKNEGRDKFEELLENISSSFYEFIQVR